MLKQGMTKTEIEKDLQGKGNFVQIDHLNRFLKEQLPMDTKKFIFIKLASLYESAKILTDAAKMYDNAAELAIPFAEKIEDYLKETSLYIKAGDFERAEQAMKKAMSQTVTLKDKEAIADSVKRFYREQAQASEKAEKRNHAIKLYEKILEFRVTDQERQEIKEKLMVLYNKVGKIHEYSNMERGMRKY